MLLTVTDYAFNFYVAQILGKLWFYHLILGSYMVIDTSQLAGKYHVLCQYHCTLLHN